MRTEPSGFLFSLFVRSLFSTNRALRRDTSSCKPIGEIRCILGHQRLGERFFPLRSILFLRSFFLLLIPTRRRKNCERGRKVAVTNKLHPLIDTMMHAWVLFASIYSLVFSPLFPLPSSSSIPAISNTKEKEKGKKQLATKPISGRAVSIGKHAYTHHSKNTPPEA